MPYATVYHPEVRKDIESLDHKQRKIISKAIDTPLRIEPAKYGKPVSGSLKGYWKLRVGDVRVVFKIVRNELLILGIIHRKMVYEKIFKRL